MEEILRRLTDVSARQHKLNEQLVARQDQLERAMSGVTEVIAGRIPLPEPQIASHRHLTKLTDLDDIEAYLHTFEVIAVREAWNKTDWVQILAPFLTGEAQRAYFALQAPANADYEALKAEILARVGISPINAAHQFQAWTFHEEEPVRAQAAHLTRLTHLWLRPEESTAAQVAERVVIDRMLRALPRRLRAPVSMKDPGTYRELVEAMELALATAAHDTRERATVPPPEDVTTLATDTGHPTASGEASGSLSS